MVIEVMKDKSNEGTWFYSKGVQKISFSTIFIVVLPDARIDVFEKVLENGPIDSWVVFLSLRMLLFFWI